MLKNYRHDGGLALLSSHQWESLQNLCDMFVLLDQGQVLAVGALDFLREAASLPSEASLREIYLAFMEQPVYEEDYDEDSLVEAEPE
jgi:ABC-2 type transport system ATP-binding protein